MTVGIAHSGPHAVSVVTEALRVTEMLGAGAIGGFAVLAALDSEGTVHYCETQNGGSAKLSYPASWLSYERAALISSGPNRPAPLVQFLPGLDKVGVVTGHRLPNRDLHGTPINVAAVNRLAQGDTARGAIAAVLDAYPECDAGLIALTAAGDLAVANSPRVERRLDVYTAVHEHSFGTTALLMNSIAFPAVIDGAGPAALIAQVAVQRFSKTTASSVPMLALVDEHCELKQADHDLITVNTATRRVIRIASADPLQARAIGRWTIIQNGTAVVDTEGKPLGISYNDVVASLESNSISVLPEQSSLGLVIGRQP